MLWRLGKVINTEVKIINDVKVAYEFLKDKVRYNYIYQFSNLSTKEWEKVICYGLFVNRELKEIAMLSISYDIPVLLAASFENEEYNTELISRIKKLLPPKFYTHIDRITLENVFSENRIFDLHEYINMGLCDYDLLEGMKCNETVRLGVEDIDDIKKLMSESYPEAWLDDELVKLNENFGLYADEKLVSFAGIHAYSEQYQVAEAAHVTTHPEYRKRGYGEKVVAALSNSLKDKIKFIGLNVKLDNYPAINCYKKLGYKEFGKFLACEIENG